MRDNNPAVIPRNHLVEAALEAATERGDYSVMEQLLGGTIQSICTFTGTNIFFYIPLSINDSLPHFLWYMIVITKKAFLIYIQESLFKFIYRASFANTLWNASTVFAICSSVCAVDRNMPSNCDGGRKIPSSAISR